MKICEIYTLLILCSIFCFIWGLYLVTIKKIYGDVLYDLIPKIKLPYKLKCTPKYYQCAQGDIDSWSWKHVILYAAFGIFLPNQWKMIIILSISFEFFEYFIGFRARFWQDTLFNCIGYFIGNNIIAPYLSIQLCNNNQLIYTNLKYYSPICLLLGIYFLLIDLRDNSWKNKKEMDCDNHIIKPI